MDHQTEPVSAILTPTDSCRYRLDDTTSATITLPDGRKLGYAQYGLATGQVVFYCHGIGGARIEGTYFEALASKLKARVIAIDRPAYGWSSPHPNRTILDFAKDVEHLADHLNLQSYGVLGASGGGPYALACAASLPTEKLKAVTLICGLGPPDAGYGGLNWHYWLGLCFIKMTILHRYLSNFVRWWLKDQPQTRLDLTDEQRLELLQQQRSKDKGTMHAKDIALLNDVDADRVFMRTARESFSQGYDAFTQDALILSKSFGFRLEDIRPDLPIRMWYGTLDTHVPPRHAEYIAAKLGSRAHLTMKEETHSSIWVNWRDRALEDLVRVMNESAEA